MTEALLQRLILQHLKRRSDVIWAYRTMAGRMGGYKLGEAGQPDITCVVDCGDGTISLIFMEVKLEGQKLRYEQLRFFQDQEGKPKTLCCVINDSMMLNHWISKAKEL